jgi:hypothetical protein
MEAGAVAALLLLKLFLILFEDPPGGAWSNTVSCSLMGSELCSTWMMQRSKTPGLAARLLYTSTMDCQLGRNTSTAPVCVGAALAAHDCLEVN